MEKSLLYYSILRHHSSVTGLLLEKGAGSQTEDTDTYGMTLLHHAAWKGCTSSVATLLREGANTNARDNSGMTVLQYAAIGRQPDTVKLLLERRRCPMSNMVDDYGMRALHYAAWTVSRADSDRVEDQESDGNLEPDDHPEQRYYKWIVEGYRKFPGLGDVVFELLLSADPAGLMQQPTLD